MSKNGRNSSNYHDLVMRIHGELSSKTSEIFDSFTSEYEEEGSIPGDKTIEILDAFQAAMTLSIVKFMTINAVSTQEGSFGEHSKEDELLKLLGMLTYQASDFIYGYLHGKEVWPVVKTIKYN